MGIVVLYFSILKYYYTAVAVPLLGVLVIYVLMSHQKKYRLIFSVITLFLISIIIMNLHYNLNFTRVLSILYENYNLSTALSTGKAIQYYNFDGSALGFLINIPLALLSGLFRPTVFESENIFQLIVAVENLAIFCACVFVLWKYGTRLKSSNIYVVTTLIYIAAMSTLIAFATPNFGTLSRYKIAYWPFFVLLIASLYFSNKKGQALKPDL